MTSANHERARARRSRTVVGMTAFICLSLLVLSSCLTAQDPLQFEYAPLFGMIYDADNEPVAGATVTVNGERRFESGVMGRVVIPNLVRGTHLLSVSKTGYEPVELEIDFLTRSHVLYVRMVSFDLLLADAETALSRGRFLEAERMLDRAARLDPANPRADYVRALLSYRRGDGGTAERVLLRLIESGHGLPYVNLLLADIREFLLDDPEGAAESLRGYLHDREDPEAEARYKTLGGDDAR